MNYDVTVKSSDMDESDLKGAVEITQSIFTKARNL